MAMSTHAAEVRALLEDKAARLRIDSIRSTTAAGSGHPTSCTSAAEIVATLFFSVMRYDPKTPKAPGNDTFILSKGHAAPLLYAAWAEAGFLNVDDLLQLRKINSDLEGHPTPRAPFVEVATGSLGQGLSIGVGMGLFHKYFATGDQRVYVLMGDAESAEGSVWEAAALAAHYKLSNLCATIDVNRLGQSEQTMYGHDLAGYQAKWAAFGWSALVVDGHDVDELLEAYATALFTRDQPTIVLARTIKGKGIPSIEDENGHHGKPLPPDLADKTIRELESRLSREPLSWKPKLPQADAARVAETTPQRTIDPPYKAGGEPVATRKAFSSALAALGGLDHRIVVLDGDVKNSTYTELFEEAARGRLFQMYIAEQNMVGAAMGLAAKGKIPFACTFAAFLTRAYDFIRMAAISHSNIKLMGSHVGVSIGEDGPSQMGLEDLAMFCAEPDFTVLYPSDAVSAWRAAELAARHVGPAYVRTSRPNTPVVYGPQEKFSIGKCKVVRQSNQDQLAIVAAGVTLFEALKAHDELKRQGINSRIIDLFSVQPLDREALRKTALEVGGRIITVEDHYAHGGIGDAVAAMLAEEHIATTFRKLAIREIARSGTSQELMERYGISSRHIVRAAKDVLEWKEPKQAKAS